MADEPILVVFGGATDQNQVSVRKQGGDWVAGWVIGRLGKQLLVRYQILSGAWRERFFQPHRVKLSPEFSVETLPRWRRRKCHTATCTPAWWHGDNPHTHLELVP